MSVITADEWKRRCAAQYIKRAGLDEKFAMEAAEATFGTVAENGDDFTQENPEDYADEDMDCWTDDGEKP